MPSTEELAAAAALDDARRWLAHLERGMVAEGIPPDVRERVLQRVAFGDLVDGGKLTG